MFQHVLPGGETPPALVAVAVEVRVVFRLQLKCIGRDLIKGKYLNEVCTGTDFPAHSDILGTWEKCHCNQIVTVTRGSLVTNKSFGTRQKCHCKRVVTVNSVTVSGEICR